MNDLIAMDFTLDPTFNIYDANRDLHRARRAEWHENYTLLLFGDFMHLVEMRMALIGSTGAQNRKLNGNKTIAYG